MSVGEICNREVIVIGRGESALDAARLMREFHVGDLVVVEERGGERTPMGIVTDRDIVLEVMAQGIEPSNVTAGDIMSFELVTAHEADDLLNTIKKMRAEGIRRIPVVNERGALAGILAVDDLIDLLAEQLTDLVRLINQERRREGKRRP